MPKTLIVISGPTAVGKTGIAIRLAKHLNTSVISADSRQCYYGMSIGTAQPSPEELATVKHYFINAFPLSTPLTAADFERLALEYLEEIFAKADTAILCGGTGLYIKALCEGLDEMPPVKPEIASQVDEAYKAKGIAWLQDAIKAEDPLFAEGPEWNNPARLMRALAFHRSAGESILNYRSGNKKERPFSIIKIALNLPRDLLYARINTRVDSMMSAGLLEEVKALLPYRNRRTLQTVGYSELFEYLDGNCSLQEATDKIRQHTRNYAKRQITWLKKDKEMHWLAADDPHVTDSIVKMISS